MRVSLSLQMNSTAGYLRDAAEKMLEAQRTVTTGKKITKPSDDPTLANRSMSLRSSINGIDQFQQNTTLAKSMVDMGESTVGSIADQIQQLQGIAQQGANSALGNDTKTALTSKIDTIRQALLGLAGTKHLDKYIFSGAEVNTPPIAANPAVPPIPPYIYNGDNLPMDIRIQPAEKMQANVTADRVFNLDGSAGAGIKDVFTTMDDLETAINTGDRATCTSLMNDVQKNYENVIDVQGNLGARSARLAANTSALTGSKDQMSELLSNLEDVDLPSAIINLQTQQNVYQAALAVTSKLSQRTLADYLS